MRIKPGSFGSKDLDDPGMPRFAALSIEDLDLQLESLLIESRVARGELPIWKAARLLRPIDRRRDEITGETLRLMAEMGEEES